MRAWINLGCLFLGQAATVAGMAALAVQMQEELAQPWLLAAGLAVCFSLLAMLPGKWLSLSNGRWHVWLLWASALLLIAGLGTFLIHPLCVVGVVPALAVVLPLRTALVSPAALTAGQSPTRWLALWLAVSALAGCFGLLRGSDFLSMEGPGPMLPAGHALLAWAFALAMTLVGGRDIDVEEPWADAAQGAATRSALSLSADITSLRWFLPLSALFHGSILALLLLTVKPYEWLMPGQALVRFLLGLAVGAVLISIQKHPRRILGLIPWLTAVLAIGLLWLANVGRPHEHLLGLGVVTGMLAAALHSALHMDAPLRALFRVELLHGALALLLGVSLSLAGARLERNFWDFFRLDVAESFMLVCACLNGLAAVAGFYFLRREVVEQMLEILIWPLYRFRGAGPGLAHFPRRGPVLVVANHSAYLDPIWLAKVLPRRLIPMMTSVFYDLPVLRWMMVHLAKAIRVEAKTFRREVPELQDAIAALDRGEVVVVFPEASLRKKESQYVRQFGQGLVHILRQRPNTPVVTCWIEGGWGSYFSYFQGPPTKNKKFDFFRTIRIGFEELYFVDPWLLEDHRRARAYFMTRCLHTRSCLDLEVPELDVARDYNWEENDKVAGV